VDQHEERAGDDGLKADLERYLAADAAREAALADAAGEDPGEVHPGLLPLVWLLGSWRGEGVAAGAPGEPDLPVTLEANFEVAGGLALAYAARTLVGGRVLTAERGFWRATPAGVEVVLAQASGVLEVLIGVPAGARLELVSDLVARTATAPSDTASTRLYGLVERQLLFAVDVATDGQPLRARLSGAMDRAPAAPPT